MSDLVGICAEVRACAESRQVTRMPFNLKKDARPVRDPRHCGDYSIPSPRISLWRLQLKRDRAQATWFDEVVLRLAETIVHVPEPEALREHLVKLTALLVTMIAQIDTEARKRGGS